MNNGGILLDSTDADLPALNGYAPDMGGEAAELSVAEPAELGDVSADRRRRSDLAKFGRKLMPGP